MKSISDLMQSLRPDPWRVTIGFSDDMIEAHDLLFGSDSASRHEEVLARWIERSQPCLFGKMAAKLDAIRFCLIGATLLARSDDEIHATIQDARLRWRRDAIHGRASAFVIVLAAPQLALALPDEVVQQLAIRSASLYLERVVEVDQVCNERVFLETPGSRSGWEWRGGVDYFAAHADKRWWQDHRFPGGIAFSVNSLGHFVRCAQVARALEEFDAALELRTEADLQRPRLETQARALEFAMRTIRNAGNAVSGKATMLVDASAIRHPRCPALSSDFDLTDVTHYNAFYDTDFTLRSEFFRPDVERPADVPVHTMDLTYIYDCDLENFDHRDMMRGVQYKGGESTGWIRATRSERMVPRPVSADTDDDFKIALGSP